MKTRKIRINADDIIGKRLGKLTVVRYVGYYRDQTKGGIKVRHLYECVCDCGRTNVVRRSPLLCDIVHSCGCSKQWSNRKRK